MTRDISQATVHKDKVRPSSAVSRWSMDSSDVSSGVISDSWGSNDGTLNGGVTTGASGVGGSEAFSFDGSNDYVSVPDNSSLDISSSSSLTVSYWIKSSYSYSGNASCVISKGNSSGGVYKVWDNILVGEGNNISQSPYDEPGLRATWQDGSNDAYAYIRESDVLDGTWNMVTTVTDKALGKGLFYLNGVLYDTVDISSIGDQSNSDDVEIMANIESSSHMPGKLDELRIYSEALNQQQIWKLYNIGRNANWGYTRS